ncbi:JmjC domain-containing protein 8 [Elysia marginata]|uniref:JmjC domain-containing protein 8 n=1 Tax=Elysia marginata TaxID=1093978 RepID=A0AAV4FMI7_9GAST|nr:JmjC domain-containing protein 8 [Elysia marginata]
MSKNGKIDSTSKANLQRSYHPTKSKAPGQKRTSSTVPPPVDQNVSAISSLISCVYPVLPWKPLEQFSRLPRLAKVSVFFSILVAIASVFLTTPGLKGRKFGGGLSAAWLCDDRQGGILAKTPLCLSHRVRHPLSDNVEDEGDFVADSGDAVVADAVADGVAAEVGDVAAVGHVGDFDGHGYTAEVADDVAFDGGDFEEVAASAVGGDVGEWRPPSEPMWRQFGTDRCTIERVSVLDLSPERFQSEFRFKKSVLVTFPNGAADWTNPGDWTRRGLSESYSHWGIHSGQSLEIVRKGGNANHVSTFKDYVDNFLMVDRPVNDTSEPKLGAGLRLPPYFQINTTADDSIFFLGPSLSGVVFHKHSDTWNGVVHGLKRWFLYPNSASPPGGKLASSFVHHIACSVSLFLCVYLSFALS